ncbi:MAG: glycosyltransferase [Pseudomonadales bacterium]|nr:glycosyltransferase [Pseudomonadales bacterium]
MLLRVRLFMLLITQAIEKRGGIAAVFNLVYRKVKREGISLQFNKLFQKIKLHSKANDISNLSLPEVFHDVGEFLDPRVLIIAELSIPQCTKYRVDQKKELLGLIDIPCKVCDWTDLVACFSALSTHTTVIFYRVPGHAKVLELVNEAKRLKLDVYWEVDDLIFKRDVLEVSKNISVLDKTTIAMLLSGADLYKTAMLACGKTIASTSSLANEMLSVGVKQAYVIENALDEQTLRIAETILSEQVKEQAGAVRIVYGSGTDTHDVDFKEAETALLYILENFPKVEFCLIGKLNLADEFETYQERIERIPFCSYKEYLGLLAKCDINIAPLEDSIFNEGKSNIKYLEASAVKLPSICSARSTFKQVIDEGENGFLCNTESDWINAFTRLIQSKELRSNIANSAYETIMRDYLPQQIANQQVASLFSPSLVNSKKKRILSVNIFYSPKSFGGATIVAEQVNQILNERDDLDVVVFTSLHQTDLPGYSLRRYQVGNTPVFGVSLPSGSNDSTDFENPDINDAFLEVLASTKPDIVHFHSIQGMGVTMIDICQKLKIPYCITLHDAWWICGRQFLIDKNNKFCTQETIDLNVCDSCVSNSELNRYRAKRLTPALLGAETLLSPSKHFAGVYAKNVDNNCTIKINKNGILFPKEIIKKTLAKKIRFGYVGGNTEIKGIHLILQAFKTLNRNDYELVVVDNTLNLGYSSFSQGMFDGIDNCKIVGAYTQETMDDFFQSIDVLLFPTQWKESFGLTVREAIARNVWVIATDAGGVVEDIIPGENGTVIPLSDDYEYLRTAVNEVLNLLPSKFNNASGVDLQKEHINTFQDQAAELANFFLH